MVSEAKNFDWKNRKVLVTGAGGFVGSHLSRKLAELGADVTAVVSKKHLDKLQTGGKLHKLRQVACDLTVFKDVEKLFSKSHIETVFHLASSPIVSKAAKEPWPTIQNNVIGTLNVLECCRKGGVKQLLLASSDKAYGDHAVDELEPLPYREDYSLRGLDVYSASKVCADTLAQAYAFQYKMQIAVLRCCNIFGPGDINFTRLIPRTIIMLLSKRAPEIKTGHENVLREYLYIEDAVRAYIFLAEHITDYYGVDCKKMPAKGKQTYGWLSFNIGSYAKVQTTQLEECQNIRSVKGVIASLNRQVGGMAPVVVKKPRQFIEIPDEYLDSSKIIGLGFKTATNFDQGLAEAVAWYRKNFKSLQAKFLSQVNV